MTDAGKKPGEKGGRAEPQETKVPGLAASSAHGKTAPNTSLADDITKKTERASKPNRPQGALTEERLATELNIVVKVHNVRYVHRRQKKLVFKAIGEPISDDQARKLLIDILETLTSFQFNPAVELALEQINGVAII